MYLVLGSTNFLYIGYQDIKIYLEIFRYPNIKKNCICPLEVKVFSSFEISKDIEKWIEDKRYECWI